MPIRGDTIEVNGRRMTTRHIEPHVSKPSVRGGDFNESAMKCVYVDHLKEGPGCSLASWAP